MTATDKSESAQESKAPKATSGTSRRSQQGEHYGLETDGGDPLINTLVRIIHCAVKVLAVLMTFVIIWGILDVVWVLFSKLREPPYLLLSINDILATFGAFLAVLIAIEIFINIVVYLRHDAIHVQLVLATALMAIARKVIIFDYAKHSPDYVWATGIVIVALAGGYWLIAMKNKT